MSLQVYQPLPISRDSIMSLLDSALAFHQPLQPEITFGWSRRTVALGLAERRTGIMCLGAQSAFSGRKRWEDTQPQVAAALCHLAEAHAQQDPTFRTSLAYTRLTVQAALAALRSQGYREDQWPSPSTMAEVLNSMS